jgi:hypothetical protein
MTEVERPRSKKVATATFRISESVYQALQKEADKQDTSLNTLVNQLFDAHVNDRVFLEKLDYMRVNRATFRRILEGTSDQTLTEAGQFSGRETVRTVTVGRGGQLTLEALLETVCSLADFAKCMRYSAIKSNGKEIVVLTHDLGPKWSIFIANLMGSAFELLDRVPKITQGDNSVLVEISELSGPNHGQKSAWMP